MKRKADRALTPRRPDYNRLYQAYSKEKFGARNGVEMFTHLDEVIKDYIKEYVDATIQFQPYEEDVGEDGEPVITPFILIIVTERMKRVHKFVSTVIVIVI